MVILVFTTEFLVSSSDYSDGKTGDRHNPSIRKWTPLVLQSESCRLLETGGWHSREVFIPDDFNWWAFGWLVVGKGVIRDGREGFGTQRTGRALTTRRGLNYLLLRCVVGTLERAVEMSRTRVGFHVLTASTAVPSSSRVSPFITPTLSLHFAASAPLLFLKKPLKATTTSRALEKLRSRRRKREWERDVVNMAL